MHAIMPSLNVLLLVSFLVVVPSTSGFVVDGRSSISSARRSAAPTATITTILDCMDSYTTSSSLYSIPTNSSRRNFIEQSIATSIASLVSTSIAIPIVTPQAAIAKEGEATITTRQTVTDAFNAIRTELSSPTGLISTLTNLINANSYPEIMQYTKESDAYFRKAKLGKARKLLTDNALKNDAILMSNAVTFDLIGINRASRPGQENREEQMKYLAELQKDIERFLELESTIVVAGE
jgi:hypothetical protein